MLLSFALLLLWRGADVLAGTGVRRFVLLLLALILLSSLLISHYASQDFPTVQRLAETADGNLELERSALGTYSPLTDVPRKSALRNVESRVWLWGKTVRYLIEHPAVLFTGIGNDRKRFLEEVVGLTYTGDLVHFQTAHNLFLDVLIKGGLIALVPLLAGCVWLFRVAVKAVTSPMFYTKLAGVAGIGCVLLSFWPPFLVINLVGEEMFTDNLQLHWTMLFGLLLGLFSLAVSSRESLESRDIARLARH
jgi:O-antigen ligase